MVKAADCLGPKYRYHHIWMPSYMVHVPYYLKGPKYRYHHIWMRSYMVHVPYYLKVSYVGTGAELMSEQLENDAVDSLVGFGLNLLGFDPLVESFEANHRHWDQILQ